KDIPFILGSPLGLGLVLTSHSRLTGNLSTNTRQSSPLFPICWRLVCTAHSRCCIDHRLLNLIVTAAAAQITGQVGANLFHRRRRIFLQKTFGAQNKSGCAIGTLKRAVIDERLLNRMDVAAMTEALE